MHTYISRLRGINVSGKNKLPMTTLKDLYQMLGCMHVTTYIQSGNVILQTASSITALEHNLSQAIKEKFGYTIPVLVREVAFFSSIVAQNPFKDCDPSTLYVTLLGDADPPSTNSKYGGWCRQVCDTGGCDICALPHRLW